MTPERRHWEEYVKAQGAYFESLYAGKRLPELEDIILTSPFYAYAYAMDVIKGRWIEAENIIATCWVPASYGLYLYAKNVIKGKLPTELHNRMLCFAIVEPNARHIKTYFKSKKYQ